MNNIDESFNRGEFDGGSFANPVEKIPDDTVVKFRILKADLQLGEDISFSKIEIEFLDQQIRGIKYIKSDRLADAVQFRILISMYRKIGLDFDLWRKTTGGSPSEFINESNKKMIGWIIEGVKKSAPSKYDDGRRWHNIYFSKRSNDVPKSTEEEELPF